MWQKTKIPADADILFTIGVDEAAKIVIAPLL